MIALLCPWTALPQPFPKWGPASYGEGSLRKHSNMFGYSFAAWTPVQMFVLFGWVEPREAHITDKSCFQVSRTPSHAHPARMETLRPGVFTEGIYCSRTEVAHSYWTGGTLDGACPFP
jgi:hypothetical protein